MTLAFLAMGIGAPMGSIVLDDCIEELRSDAGIPQEASMNATGSSSRGYQWR